MRLTIDFLIGSREVKDGSLRYLTLFITNHPVQRVRAGISTERYTHSVVPLHFPTQKA